ncbi:hypothetical protein [Clostridium massiliodielmoense]|uniref:hypothetical protein n=1 Tax=Clostridium massiliodielmoense TaxID=1776385 RepID=UPI0001668ED4|nr:hypothetical protein [Clostridium massiliodielmoense]EDS77378.1 hypothetical protein CBC_A0801 [Clostridium botulinum C str. Eklund]NEZ50259.1 hypothetical protein [Clostridium botulinum]
MRKQKESLVQRIVLKYEDGTEKEIDKGVVITLGKEDVEGNTNLAIEFADCKKKDLATVIWGVMNMADEMGMLDIFE